MGILSRNRKPQPSPVAQTTTDPVLWASLLGLTVDENSLYVTYNTVTGIPALNAAVNMIAHPVAHMMVSANVYDGDVEVEVPDIIRQPTEIQRPFEFYVQMVRSLLIYGNFVALNFGDQLVPVDPTTVALDTSKGIPYYQIADKVFKWDAIVHIRKDAPPSQPYWGTGLLHKYNRALRGRLAMQNYGIAAYTDAGPRSIVSLNPQGQAITREQLLQFRDSWDEFIAEHKQTLIVPAGQVNYTPLNWSPLDSQFVEAFKVSIAEAALMLDALPSDLEASLGAQGALTYQNLDQQVEERRRRLYQPVASLIEEALSQILPDDQIVKSNPEALLRATTKERFEIYKLGLDMGIYTVDEVRELEDLPPLPEDQEVNDEPDNQPSQQDDDADGQNDSGQSTDV